MEAVENSIDINSVLNPPNFSTRAHINFFMLTAQPFKFKLEWFEAPLKVQHHYAVILSNEFRTPCSFRF